ncbi:MAG: hypothetical protein AAF921_17955 [Cyanobacteria bacterium P01_D01_bin.44]
MTTQTPAKPAPQFSAEYIQEAIDAILETLGQPATPSQTEALLAFNSRDDKSVRVLAASHLDDNFIKALGYLISAPKLLPTTPVILSEAARSAADHVRDRTLATLSDILEKSLRS